MHAAHSPLQHTPNLRAMPLRARECPPQERYSDDPRDLSEAPSYATFLEGYRRIIGHALRRLGRDRFACFVVGEIRDADGFCRNFVGDTIGVQVARPRMARSVRSLH